MWPFNLFNLPKWPNKVTIRVRQSNATAWSSVDPVLRPGELGLETDTQLFKIGDGTTPWTALAYNGEKMPKIMIPEFDIYIGVLK